MLSVLLKVSDIMEIEEAQQHLSSMKQHLVIKEHELVEAKKKISFLEGFLEGHKQGCEENG